MTRVQARATLLSIALHHAIEVGLDRQGPRDAAIHESRELRREVRRERLAGALYDAGWQR